MTIIKKFETARPFTELEAWALFRLAAYAEAIGWTFLIAGIVLEYVTGSHSYVAIGGRIHGTLFFGYLAACIVLYPSLGWSRWRTLWAVTFSIPPYGSVVFERLIAYKRRANGFRTYRQYLLYNLIISVR